MSRTAIKLTGLQTNGIGDNVQPLPANVDILALSIRVASGSVAIGDFGLITLYGNADPLHQYQNGSEIDDINQYDLMDAYGANSRNILRLDFERLGLRDAEEFYGATFKINQPADGNNQGGGNPIAMGLPEGTPVFTSGKLEFTVGAGATTPTFEVYAEVERKINAAVGAGPVMRRKRYTEVLSGTAEQGFTRWVFGSKKHRFVRRVFLSNSGGGISRVRVTADGKEVFNRTADENVFLQRLFGKVGPVGQWDYIIDFTENGIAEDLDTLGLGEMEWNITPDASGTLVAILEYGGDAW